MERIMIATHMYTCVYSYVLLMSILKQISMIGIYYPEQKII